MDNFSRTLILISGLIMIALGVWFLCNPQTSLLAFTVFMGLLLVVTGIFRAITFFTNRAGSYASGWVLVDGILSLLLGLVLLFNIASGSLALVLFLAIWLLFVGITRTVIAYRAKLLNVDGWSWIMLLGIAAIVLGFISLFNPVVAAFGLVATMGIFFIIEGISAVALYFFSGRAQCSR